MTMINRPVKEIVLSGFKGRCPNCAEGKIFSSYLKIVDHCPNCREELHHHRADDLPAYYVVLFVGHLIVTLALYVEFHFHPSYWVHFALWFPSVLGLSLGLLQPVKGAVAAYQWHMGMHGFRHAKEIRNRNF